MVLSSVGEGKPTQPFPGKCSARPQRDLLPGAGAAASSLKFPITDIKRFLQLPALFKVPPNPNIHLKNTTASTLGKWSSKSLGLFLTVYSHEQKNIKTLLLRYYIIISTALH